MGGSVGQRTKIRAQLHHVPRHHNRINRAERLALRCTNAAPIATRAFPAPPGLCAPPPPPSPRGIRQEQPDDVAEENVRHLLHVAS